MDKSNLRMWMQLMETFTPAKKSKRSEGRAVVCCKCGCGGTLYKSGGKYICRKCREKEVNRR